jgi:sugar phosphate isomerase/epimerase
MSDPISIQLYSLRSLGDIDLVLDTVAAAGYANVEPIGSHLDDAANVAAKLKARNLTVSSSHVSLAQLRERPQAIVEACRTLGFATLYMPAVPPDQRDQDGAAWRALGLELGRMAESFKAQGIELGYHNHNWELTPKEGAKTALELIFEAAGSAPLSWQVDVAWLVRGGGDPKAWMARYASRVTAAHVKDIAPAGQNLDQDGWADVGHGVLDWRDLWTACRNAGAKWMVVEHDKPADPAASVRRSLAFLRSLQG